MHGGGKVEARFAALERRIAQLEEALHRMSERNPDRGAADPSVQRVRGIIIEDEQGRSRILLGAPVPKASGRKRTDPTTSLVVVDENGNDRLVLGFVPDAQVQGRIEGRGTPVVGIAVCDQNGDERGGFGIFDASGNVGMGLDYPGGREAVSLFVMRNGLAGFAVNDRHLNDQIMLAFNGDDGTGVAKVPSLQNG